MIDDDYVTTSISLLLILLLVVVACLAIHASIEDAGTTMFGMRGIKNHTIVR